MTQSIGRIRASDGSGNANLATVQSTRAIGATTLVVDTVLGINGATFEGSMGTPHTFTDPVTSETITVISEATCVDFIGHVNGVNLVIDTIAPGYSDLGSAIGDVVIIRPTTDWANNVANVLAISHNDDGSLIGSAVRTALGETVPSGAGWTAGLPVPNSVTYNGNRQYTLVFNATDLTPTISNLMKLQFLRTTAAPTQCTSLNGSTQYFNKTSPNKLTFTDDFVVDAWIKVTTLVAGTIASRYNGTSGWSLFMTGFGLLQLIGVNGGSGNNSAVTSVQSVPVARWIHVTGQLDMSTFTATPTTSYIMFDGLDVPATVSRAGTNPTALIQAGNLEIGGQNGGTQPWNGKIAQVAIFNAKVTQATIRTYISQGMIGSETSLASAYSFNNSINDLNATTPNNLTAQGSAVATNADSPFSQDDANVPIGTKDYAVVTSRLFSTNTTLTVQVPEGSTIPTIGAITTMNYSLESMPYGFPAKLKFIVELAISNATNTSGTTTNTAYNPGGLNLMIPVGSWDTIAQYEMQVTCNASSPSIYTGLSPTTSFIQGSKFNSRILIAQTNTSNPQLLTTTKRDTIVNTAMAAYYILLSSINAFTQMSIRGDTTVATGGEITTVTALLVF